MPGMSETPATVPEPEVVPAVVPAVVPGEVVEPEPKVDEEALAEAVERADITDDERADRLERDDVERGSGQG